MKTRPFCVIPHKHAVAKLAILTLNPVLNNPQCSF